MATFVENIQNADRDAIDLGEVVNGDPNTQVRTRLGRMIWTLSTLNQKIEGANLLLNRFEQNINALSGQAAQKNGWTTDLVVNPQGFTQEQINNRQKNLLDFGAVADTNVDSSVAVQNAINTTNPVLIGNASYYAATIPENPYGVPYSGKGSMQYTPSVGGRMQLNSYVDNYGKNVLGLEYMYRFLQRIAEGGVLRGHLFGDSTVAMTANGGGFAGQNLEPQNILKKLFRAKGIINQVYIENHAIGGTSVKDMDAVKYIDTVNYTTDFFIIKYGINDAQYGLEAFATNLRAKLKEIRTSSNQGRVTDLTIFLMMPNATYAPSMGHNNIWSESLRDIYVKAARDYKCVLFDSYAQFRDMSWAPGSAMDSLRPGEGIHPTGILQNQIWSAFVDAVINETAAGMFLPDPEKLSLMNGWRDYGGGFAPCEASIDKFGNVSLRGVVTGGNIASGTVIAKMPWFVKPQYTEQFTCTTASGFATLRVLTDGTLQIADNGGNATYMSLSGIRFKSN